MAFAYPLMLDVRARTVLVVGGGAVAVRKVRALLDAGATAVTVVSPEFHADLPAAVRRVQSGYDARFLEGVDLCFAVTSVKAVNDAVVKDCGDRRILVNRADTDDDAPGDFVTPAQLKKGPVTVTVTAGSAALTAAIRNALDDRWDDRWTLLAEAMRDLRPLVLSSTSLTPEQRTSLLRKLSGDDAMQRLSAGGVDALRDWVRAEIENATSAGK